MLPRRRLPGFNVCRLIVERTDFVLYIYALMRELRARRARVCGGDAAAQVDKMIHDKIEAGREAARVQQRACGACLCASARGAGRVGRGGER